MNTERISTFVQLLLNGDKKTTGETTELHLRDNGQSIIALYETLYKPALYRVGELWEINKISVADEHLATAITESLMNGLFSHIISRERKNKRVVVSCIEGEQHQVGSKMVADVFEMHGWDALYLGANTPLTELIPFLEKNKPEIIAISLAIYWNIPTLEKWVIELTERFPTMQIILGGQAFAQNRSHSFHKKNTTIIQDLNQLESFIKTH